MLWMLWLVARSVSIEPLVSLGFCVAIPATLKDRASGGVLHDTNIGPWFTYVIKKRKN